MAQRVCGASAAPRLDLGSIQCVGSVTLAGILVSQKGIAFIAPSDPSDPSGNCGILPAQPSAGLATSTVSFVLLLAVHDVLSQGVYARERLLRPAPTRKHSSAVVFLMRWMGVQPTAGWNLARIKG